MRQSAGEPAADLEPDEVRLRACGCSFCRSHNTRTASDPSGAVDLWADDWSLVHPLSFRHRHRGVHDLPALRYLCQCVRRYRLRYARSYQSSCLDDRAFFTREPAATDHDGETTDDRLARRAANWTPATIHRLGWIARSARPQRHLGWALFRAPPSKPELLRLQAKVGFWGSSGHVLTPRRIGRSPPIPLVREAAMEPRGSDQSGISSPSFFTASGVSWRDPPTSRPVAGPAPQQQRKDGQARCSSWRFILHEVSRCKTLRNAMSL